MAFSLFWKKHVLVDIICTELVRDTEWNGWMPSDLDLVSIPFDAMTAIQGALRKYLAVSL